MALVNPRFKVESRSQLLYRLFVDYSGMALYWPEGSHNGLRPQANTKALPLQAIKHMKTIIAYQYTY